MNEKRRQLVEQLYKLIREGDFVKNNKLPTEKELIQLLDAPRQTLREALIVLESFGIIDVRERHGIFIKDKGIKNVTKSLDLLAAWPADVIPQVFEMRIVLEPSAAEFAAVKRNETDMKRMAECLKKLQNLYDENHPQKGSLGLHWNSMLHSVIIASAHNDVLKRTYEGVSGITEKAITSLETYNFTLPYANWPEIILDEHVEIVKAIIDQDKARASTLMKEHLKLSASRLRQIYDFPALKIFYGEEN